MMESAPKRSTLAENVKCVKPETFERVHQLVIGRAKHDGFENGKRVRIDSTAIDSNIHDPSDSSLLYDVVRVLPRILTQAQCWSTQASAAA
jgi:IS5 family transposase